MLISKTKVNQGSCMSEFLSFVSDISFPKSTKRWILEETYFHFLCYLQYNGYKHDTLLSLNCITNRASSVAQIVKNLPKKKKNLPLTQETQIHSLGQEVPMEKRMATHSVFLPWTEEPGQAIIHGVAKSQIQLKWLSRQTSLTYFHHFLKPRQSTKPWISLIICRITAPWHKYFHCD